MINVISKTIILYFFITLVYRILGKKELGQLSIIDLIVSILIVEIVAISIADDKLTIFYAVIPISVLVIIQLLISYITMKSHKLRYFIDGKPSVIIDNGKINFKEMVKIRYNLDDLVIQLREQGIRSIEEVKYAVLENTGKLSVFEKSGDYPLPLILDGIIDYRVLREIKKNTKWLERILQEKNIQLTDVFYAFYKQDKTFIITKKELIK